MSILRPLRMMRIAVAAGQVSPQLGRCAAFSQLKNLACMGSPLVNPLSLHSKRLLSTSEQPKAETSKGQTTSSTEGNIDAPQDAPSRGVSGTLAFVSRLSNRTACMCADIPFVTAHRAAYIVGNIFLTTGDGNWRYCLLQRAKSSAKNRRCAHRQFLAWDAVCTVLFLP